MKNALRLAVASLALCGLVGAQEAPKAPAKTATKSVKHKVAKKKVAKKKVAAPIATATSSEEFRQVKESITSLQREVQQLREENSSLSEQLQHNQQKAETAQVTAAAAAQKVEEQQPVVVQAQTDASAAKASAAVATEEVAKATQRVAALEEPTAIHFKGIKLTPGGYIQVASIYRTHNANMDTADKYGSFPLEGSIGTQNNEFRMSGRASRLSLKAEGATKRAKMMGYFEIDFLGDTSDSTENQTNSFPPRLRLAFGEVKLGHGWSIAGGQNWSLLQTTKHGIDALSEWLPAVIDNSYTTGFSYAREGTFRVTKEVIPNKLWAAVSVENPETITPQVACNVSTTGATCTGLSTVSVVGLGSAVNSFASAPAGDFAPDVVAKVAFEPGWGHYEIKGIGRFFRDRVSPATAVVTSGIMTKDRSRITESGAFGVGAILPVVAKKLDVQFQGLAGKGIGRFGTTSGPDTTENFRGDLVPVKGAQAVLGIEAHPSPKLDLDLYAGDDYYQRTTYTQTITATTPTNLTATPGTYTIGYGSASLEEDKACLTYTYNTKAVCNAVANRNIWTIQPTVWYRLYQGSAGKVQFGASYAYTYRRVWDGHDYATNSTTVHPKAIENTIMTSFRYYLP